MPSHGSSAILLRDARGRAGLTQRALASRAGTSQSVVARIEGGQTVPSVDTLDRLLAAAGFEAKRVLTLRSVASSHMLADVSRILRLSPEQRLTEVKNVNRFVLGARRV